MRKETIQNAQLINYHVSNRKFFRKNYFTKISVAMILIKQDNCCFNFLVKDTLTFMRNSKVDHILRDV